MTTAVPLGQSYYRPVRADLRGVTNDRQRRGQDLAARRLAHKLSVLALSEAVPIARATIDKAEAGKASDDSLERLEKFFDELDAETGLDTGTAPTPLAPEMIEFDITGPRTDWHVVVRGPADQADDMRRQVVELLRDMEVREPPK